MEDLSCLGTVSIIDLDRDTATRLSQMVPNYQRNRRWSLVRTLANDMENGDWELSSDAITVVTEDGAWTELANGQHRVQARLLAKIPPEWPIPVLLLEREQQDALSFYKALDVGAKRTLGDLMKAEAVPDYNAMARLVRLCYVIDTQGGVSANTSAARTVSLSGLWHYYDGMDKELASSALKIGRRVNRRTVTGGSYCAALAYLGSRDYDRERTFEFLEAVMDENTETDSTAYLIRKAFLAWSAKARLVRVSAGVQWNTLLHAYHLWCMNERRSVLRAADPKADNLPVVTKEMLGAKLVVVS